MPRLTGSDTPRKLATRLGYYALVLSLGAFLVLLPYFFGPGNQTTNGLLQLGYVLLLMPHFFFGRYILRKALHWSFLLGLLTAAGAYAAVNLWDADGVPWRWLSGGFSGLALFTCLLQEVLYQVDRIFRR